MGPLNGLKLVELAGIGPTQLAGMLLADMGAEVIRVERPSDPDLGFPIPTELNLMNRGRRSVVIDLKQPQGFAVVLRLIDRADALFEGFRPGVMERLGIGPEFCMERNPRLVYGRMTGWGQEGPLAGSVGHDPNYIALTGVLDAIGPRGGDPVLPLNLVADYGGGALYLVTGLLAALLERQRSGRGQVVDAAMIDGSASLMTLFYGLRAAGLWHHPRGSNLLDGGAPFSRPYATKDGKHIVVAAIERRFYRALLEGLEIPEEERIPQTDIDRWPELERQLEAIFRTRTRDEWCERLEGTEACVSPVLSIDETPEHPHHHERQTFIEVDGLRQPGPAPRFARTPGAIRNPPPEPGADTEAVLAEHGFTEAEIRRLATDGVIGLGPIGSD